MTQATTSPRTERRLAAILAADVAGYSRLMGIDDVGTHAALQAHRRERVDPAIARHHGRIVHTAGDGLLVEFASVVDAVTGAVAIQRAMLTANARIPEDHRIEFRIGINIGDVIIDGGDIFGDGVNVAARLEALCEPGGVCISRAANEQVRDKLSLAFADLGEQTVKNIARAVGVFGLTAKDIAALPEGALPQPEPPEVPARSRWIGTTMAGGVVLAAILAVGSWWMLHDRAAPPAVVSAAPFVVRPEADSPQERRQSAIVLPFENSSGDPAQDGIAAGFTRDVTDRLARDRGNQIVPLQTAAAYLGKTMDLRALGRDHDVHFALSGNARRQEGRLIVAVTLYEIAGERPVWSHQYDRPDTPDARRIVIATVISNINQAVVDAEAERAAREHPNSLDKRDLMIASAVTALQQGSKAATLTQIALIERALVLDPDYIWALSDDARLHANLVRDGFSSDPAADLAQARKATDRILFLRPDHSQAMRIKGNVLRFQGDLDGAYALLRRSTDLDPTNGYKLRDLGTVLLMQGQYKEALETFLTARQLMADTDSVNPGVDAGIAFGMLANDRFAEAIAEARLAIKASSIEGTQNGEFCWLTLIAAEAMNGQDALARADLQKFLAMKPALRRIVEVQKNPYLASNPKLLEGLHRTGMPAE